MGLFRNLGIGERLQAEGPDFSYDFVVRKIRGSFRNCRVEFEVFSNYSFHERFGLNAKTGLIWYAQGLKIGVRENRKPRSSKAPIHIVADPEVKLTSYDVRLRDISELRSRGVNPDGYGSRRSRVTRTRRSN